ncbi:hypothetical protein RRG08_051561 [Elysia crispata]|uniref:GPI mannosyltransferase 2 n=1 Tax=Elysia crispata TaxID=231223 RepID=A0AAE0Y0U8_9GAST|nr:hypothetical protein RRG08_051561 [Elysia crispata]
MEAPAFSIISFSIRTRLVVIILQFASNMILPDHDADVFNPPLNSSSFTQMDSAVHWLLGGFRRWDAVYFTHIMHIFMTAPYSEVLYFFTLIYALIGLQAGAKYAASFLVGLGVFTRSNGLIGTAFVLHSIAKSFLASAHHLYILHQRYNHVTFIRKVTILALKTAQEMFVCILLCVAPFFLFQYFTFIKFCQSSDEIVEPSIAAYGRQRGYHLQEDEPSSWCNHPLPLSYSYIQRHHWGVGFLQYYTWRQVPNFVLALPIIFLSLRACYYFLNLDRKASMYLGLWDFRALSLRRALMLKKVDSFEYDEDESREATQNICLISGKNDDGKIEDLQVPLHLKQLPSVSDTVVFALHLFSLVIFGLLFVHIQVLTRLLCSSTPLLYWYCATLYTSLLRTRSHLNGGSAPRLSKLTSLGVTVLSKVHLDFLVNVLLTWPQLSRELKFIFTYFITYFIVGTIMFSNFLPWT